MGLLARLLLRLMLSYHSLSIINRHTKFFTSSSSSRLHGSSRNGIPTITAPLRTMVFIDGTWLYYCIIKGHENCPIKRKYGPNWKRSHIINYNKIIQSIAENLQRQLLEQYNTHRDIDIVRTCVFTSIRNDTEVDSWRLKMISDMYASNFEVHKFITDGPQEKCVDVALAVEMLYLAVQDAYDVACIVVGDKDFIPAMQKTRLKGKRVALISMRNSCSKDLLSPELKLSDFEVMWLEDNMDEYIIPEASIIKVTPHETEHLYNMIISFLQRSNNQASSRDVGRFLQMEVIDKKNALVVLKQGYGAMRNFLQGYPLKFNIEFTDESSTEFTIQLLDDNDNDNSSSGSSTIKHMGVVSSSSDLLLSISEKDLNEALYSTNEDYDDSSHTDLLQRFLDNDSDMNDYEFEGLDRLRNAIPLNSNTISETTMTNSMMDSIDSSIVNYIVFFIEMADTEEVSSREIGRYLQDRKLLGPDGQDETLLGYIKAVHGTLFAFLKKYPSDFALTLVPGKWQEYLVSAVQHEEELMNEIDDVDDVLGIDMKTVSSVSSVPVVPIVVETVVVDTSREKETSRTTPLETSALKSDASKPRRSKKTTSSPDEVSNTAAPSRKKA